MTRINCVPVEELTGPHLVAEYRELPRVFKLMRAAQARGENIRDPRNPRRYVLGTGHVRFFYDKGLYLLRRQKALVAEMQRRGYNPTYTDPAELLPDGLDLWRMMDWAPDAEALKLNRQRIAERTAA
ncbi:endonuclease V N-glycosylase UV repair enzyme [Roseobacter phage RDJL Phi 1]|uniref:Endonuclease V n=1 Tax=Roseobacter phage RDJL Phi 1 TaxID=562742 RepID=F4YXR7_9CAUD|nr:endonuclease V N-glycosylase UV repair enzyme [Roseobacter phage RDJL Phi 1]ADK73457.1 endonuclease V [Roseobacter phage RDJL Phi 1]